MAALGGSFELRGVLYLRSQPWPLPGWKGDRMKWAGLIAAVTALLLACSSAPPVYQRDDGSTGDPTEFAHDHAICTDRAHEAEYLFLGEFRRKRAYRACMTEHGWVFSKLRPRCR